MKNPFYVFHAILFVAVGILVHVKYGIADFNGGIMSATAALAGYAYFFLTVTLDSRKHWFVGALFMFSFMIFFHVAGIFELISEEPNHKVVSAAFMLSGMMFAGVVLGLMQLWRHIPIVVEVEVPAEEKSEDEESTD